MKTQHTSSGILKSFGLVSVVLFLSACQNPLPPGEAPPQGTPIIIDPPPVVEKPASEKKQEAPPVVKPKEINGKDAVNYMLTSLATRCRPISSPGKKLPEIFNRFSISQGNVNDLPMVLWQRLIRNKMITPISDPKEEYAYILESEIELLPTPISQKQKYRWKMKLIQNNSEKKEIWQAKFDFVQN